MLSCQENAALCLFIVIIVLVLLVNISMRPKQDIRVIPCYSHVDSYVFVEDHLYCWLVRALYKSVYLYIYMYIYTYILILYIHRLGHVLLLVPQNTDAVS